MTTQVGHARLNQRMRELMRPGAACLMPGAGNALTARLIEAAGFDAMMVSGAAIANGFLGAPDIGLVSLAELAAHVGAIRDAVDLPLLVDGDTGFGNPVNVVHTVRVLERAGANAIMFEDQTFPKRCGHFDGKDVVPAWEMVQKIRAAVDTRTDERLMILARTDARAVEGLDAALERACAYRDAGADFLFIEAPIDEEELARIPRELPGIHLCNLVVGGKTPLLPRERLADMGYAAVLYANFALQASMLAMQRTLAGLRQQGSALGMEAELIGFQERQALLNGAHFEDLSLRYRAMDA